VDSPGSGLGSLAGCCECGDELSGSGATSLVYNLPLYAVTCNACGRVSILDSTPFPLFLSSNYVAQSLMPDLHRI
jgi:hypothetical protein